MRLHRLFLLHLEEGQLDKGKRNKFLVKPSKESRKVGEGVDDMPA